ncbi:MAG TPA: amidohydrolase [Candidatus Krumholzibacteria bacterium]|nr:amidohydrolase [Candidatus Krumholzibacteria bacterium]HPD72300.1 amidohydrolase [Candidatus Krumholzibacteria bacterium]HRY40768.1 amidohydrolase [Candidatus Krumholzibacteria bacterium]
MMPILALTALVAVPGPDSLPTDPPDGPVDLVLHGGRVVTMLEPEPSPAPTGLACRGDRIVWVGDDRTVLALAGPRTRVVDLEGAVAVPGLVDSHAHLYGLGKALAEIDLVGTSSAADCVERVAAAAADQPDGWLQGRGWDQNDWPGTAWPTRQLLDAAVAGRAVLLRRVDGHAAWASTEALRLAGITAATPDPAGGAIGRDAAGEPTGLLVDNAVDLVTAVVPDPAPAEERRRIRLAIDHCLRHGLVAVHEAGAPWSRVQLYRELADSGELDLRLYCLLDDQPATLDAGLAAGPFGSADGLLQVRAVKLYADGALGSRGALLLDDYADEPGTRGLPVSTVEHLRDVCRRAAAAGFQVATHAIGDAANRLVLGLYAESLGDRLVSARWRIEHAQILDPTDLPRFGRLGVIAAMQPVHCTSDMDWATGRLGPERLAGAYAWRSLLASGAVVCFGTDAPVEAVDPLAGLYAARTRAHPDGSPAGGWQPHECLDGRTALRCYTLAGAYAAFQDGESGILAPGRLADVTVLSGDPTGGDPASLLAMRALATIVGGRLRWQAE